MVGTGYSGTPLLAKLGYRAGQRALLVAVPATLAELDGFPDFAERVERQSLAALGVEGAGPFDLIHVFERDRGALAVGLAGLRDRLVPAGMVWVSWPKKAAKLPTTLDENRVRELALAAGLVDVKVCAVDPVWSGLKLVIPRARRG
jgi:hypothetical protein